MSELPRGWTLVKLDDLGSWGSGGTPKKGTPGYYGGSIPWLKIGDLSDSVVMAAEDRITEKALRESAAKLVTPGTLLVAMYGSIGKLGIAGIECATNQAIAHCRVDERLSSSRYLFWRLHAARAKLLSMGQGAGQPNISQGILRSFEVELPPLNEQWRIVEKLDYIFEKSRAAKARLERLPALLDKLKRSILAAAFRGDLTKEWRAKNPNVEPASVLLERIRAERRRKWEEGLRAKGKDPKKATYEEPAAVNAGELPELPDGWAWASLSELVFDGPSNGYSPPSAGDGSGTKSLKLSATTGGTFVLTEATTKRLLENVAADSSYWLFPGDILIQRANTIDYVGTAAVFDGPAREYIYPDLMMRVRVAVEETRDWVVGALTDARFRGYFKDRATGTAGNMPKINGGVVRDVPIPVAPIDEMREIMRRVEGEAKVVARRVEHALEAVGALERSTLAKAFRGELVPQDPSDEPASMLLERTSAVRTDEAEGQRRRRPSRPAAPDLFATKPDALSATNGLEPHRDEGATREIVVSAFQRAQRLTSAAIADATGLDAPSVKKALKALVEAGQLRVEGKARGTAYVWVAQSQAPRSANG